MCALSSSCVRITRIACLAIFHRSYRIHHHRCMHGAQSSFLGQVMNAFGVHLSYSNSNSHSHSHSCPAVTPLRFAARTVPPDAAQRTQRTEPFTVLYGGTETTGCVTARPNSNARTSPSESYCMARSKANRRPCTSARESQPPFTGSQRAIFSYLSPNIHRSELSFSIFAYHPSTFQARSTQVPICARPWPPSARSYLRPPTWLCSSPVVRESTNA
ncbi:hypothetical protein BDW22DRAFT_257056 [Trametopsis cervina]|nr:hypothetical protein BDW22DRAFT_257056 [Trametopsis cervina]